MTELRSGLPIVSFADQIALESWLAEQPSDSNGAWFRFRKKGSSLASITKAQAVDSAICYGWIDGQLDKYDAESWLIRFTPRRPRSKWSAVNRKRALELILAGRMRASGQLAIDNAKTDGRWEAAYAPASKAEVPLDLQNALDANPKAAAFFATLTGANRYAILYRIGAAKKAETRARKIGSFIDMLERGETVHG
ncbi:MAG: YdeI/OmpD-associated family protein [Candidatus Sphingomonas colombiensis]|nr:YdeI/OmpD-associated family protein [Sphingomonas sp.]WEK42427.1 MAG: YdeI/OmpD-associated family protein [Sphingomonas sp.]